MTAGAWAHGVCSGYCVFGTFFCIIARGGLLRNLRRSTGSCRHRCITRLHTGAGYTGTLHCKQSRRTRSHKVHWHGASQADTHICTHSNFTAQPLVEIVLCFFEHTHAHARTHTHIRSPFGPSAACEISNVPQVSQLFPFFTMPAMKAAKAAAARAPKAKAAAAPAPKAMKAMKAMKAQSKF